MALIVVMSCLTGLTVSWGFYVLSAFTFSMMVGVLMAVLIEKGK